MNLPTRFSDLLAKDNGLHSVVLRAISIIEPWARDNKTVFFPEYTDHSLVHLQEVLSSADSLIADQSWPQLTAEDAAITVLSVLLHDSALHLTEDGFYALIEGRYSAGASRYISSGVPWPALWDQYFAEARRFDQRRLFAIFGDTEPVQAIPRKKLDLTLKHRLLIGEFLRRHHARLAHEIALCGIPGPGDPLPIADGAQKEFLDLAGYVARSHNLSIRKAIDGLEPTKLRIHLNCRVPFVMTVLRIADYLQIHSARAPGQLLRLKTLASPVSRGEWNKHLSVKEINQAHEDPEAIFVDCEPESATAFVAMQNLLRDIQSELDHCWAVLGEVYGRFSPLNDLGITIRRIRSNIDNPESYRLARNPKYIPREFRFRTSSAELMDLLVAPLYGEKPAVGIRELVQNAVDACLERDDLVSKGLLRIEEPSQEDVLVRLLFADDGKASVVVEDYGIGMTMDVIEQYFLNVGASFRSSDLWRRNHEVEGHSTVHRTGRFGIGLLAAFLLGSEVRVTTRHAQLSSDEGMVFTCRQGADVIEVQPCSFHHGTRIEIGLSDEIAKSFAKDTDNWDWYCLERPKVRRVVVEKQERELPQEISVPACDADLTLTKWRRIEGDGYDDVMWSYETPLPRGAYSTLVCNGIFVSAYLHKLELEVSGPLHLIQATIPSLVVFDPDGRFPLNLQRDELVTGSLTFSAALENDIANYFAANLLQRFESVPRGISKELVALATNPRIRGLMGRAYAALEVARTVILPTGIIPADFDLLKEQRLSCILVDAVNLAADKGAFTSAAVVSSGVAYVPADGVTQTKSSRTTFLRDSLGSSNTWLSRDGGFFGALPIVGRRIFVRKQDVEELVTPGNVPRTHWMRLKLERDLGSYALWKIGNVPSLDLDIESISEDLKDSGCLGFTLLYIDWDSQVADDKAKSPFSEAWRRVAGTALLLQREQKA